MHHPVTPHPSPSDLSRLGTVMLWFHSACLATLKLGHNGHNGKGAALRLNYKAFGECQDPFSGWWRGSLGYFCSPPKLPGFTLCALGWNVVEESVLIKAQSKVSICPWSRQ